MLRTALFLAALVAASSNANARGGDHFSGSSVSVEPRVSVTVGSVRDDGFRVEYESGGRIYERQPRYYAAPAPVVVVPVAVPAPYYRDRDWRDDRRHWRDDRRHWRDDRRHWRDDRRHWRDDRRHWRGNHHDRHGGGHRYDD